MVRSIIGKITPPVTSSWPWTKSPLRIFKVSGLSVSLERLDFDLDHILFNSLAYCFPSFPQRPGRSGQDILAGASVWWASRKYALILENDQLPGADIVIPDLGLWKGAGLATADQLVGFHHLGYHYDFKRDNYLRKML